MRIDTHGLALIEAFEGFRGKAYRCPAGVLTIGYGHTSMAGPPAVKAGQSMTRVEAAKVLERDLGDFGAGVQDMVRTDLSDHQYAALVSFAYNVGLGAFRSSSVLRAVNARDFESVPRRLNLWVKAGPRVLPGLVRRRAAEGALFMMPADAQMLASLPPPRFSDAEYEAMDEARGLIEPLTGTPMVSSTTNIAAIIAGLSGMFGYVQNVLWQWESIKDYVPLPDKVTATIGGLVIIGAATAWIVNERWKKARDDAI